MISFKTPHFIPVCFLQENRWIYALAPIFRQSLTAVKISNILQKTVYCRKSFDGDWREGNFMLPISVNRIGGAIKPYIAYKNNYFRFSCIGYTVFCIYKTTKYANLQMTTNGKQKDL